MKKHGINFKYQEIVESNWGSKMVAQIMEKVKNFVLNAKSGNYIMMTDGRVLEVDQYSSMVNHGIINPESAFVYISKAKATQSIYLKYPILLTYYNLIGAYLSRLGFRFMSYSASAPHLKYFVSVVMYDHYLSIEIIDLDRVAVDLSKIIIDVLGFERIFGEERKLTGEEFEKIIVAFETQYIDKVTKIIEESLSNQSLVKEAITYFTTFQPYTVCYDVTVYNDAKTWKEVNCIDIRV